MKTIDLLLIGDLTGSMSRFHTLLKSRFSELCQLLYDMKTLRIGIIFFLDHGSGDPYVTRVMNLSSDPVALNRFIKTTVTGCGGDEDEALEDALHDAFYKISWRPGAAKSIVLFGDAFPHEQDACPCGRSYFSLTRKLFNGGGIINTVYCGAAYSNTPISQLVDIGIGDFSRRPYCSSNPADNPPPPAPGLLSFISTFFSLDAPRDILLTHPSMFFSWLANVTGGMAINIEQTEDLIDIIMIAAAKDSGGIPAINRLAASVKPGSQAYIKVAEDTVQKWHRDR